VERQVAHEDLALVPEVLRLLVVVARGWLGVGFGLQRCGRGGRWWLGGRRRWGWWWGELAGEP
jgi:hypothetical protein